MIDKDEKVVLKWMNDNIDESDCFRPVMIHANIKGKIKNEDDVVTICRRLQAKELIDEKNNTPNDPHQRNSCYRITKKGMDELNPNTREKKIYKIAIIGMLSAIVAAITSIISIFT